MSRVNKAQPSTISSNDLAFITSLAQAPLRRALSGVDAPPPKDTRTAAQRKEFMIKLDTQKLKDKVEKGAADEEQVQLLVNEMCECVSFPHAGVFVLGLSLPPCGVSQLHACTKT
jgi:hypothetical protein